jgi:hypothetical protein
LRTWKPDDVPPRSAADDDANDADTRDARRERRRRRAREAGLQSLVRRLANRPAADQDG